MFGKTQQIVITFVTATLKSMFTVSKTSIEIFGKKFNICNIYHTFLNVIFHISTYQHIKSAPTEVKRTEKSELQVVAKRTYTPIGMFTP